MGIQTGTILMSDCQEKFPPMTSYSTAIDRPCLRFSARSTHARDFHIGGAEPYCPELRATAAVAAEAEGIVAHPRGTVVVIGGPRFSTRAESQWFASAGWDVQSNKAL